jgi:hypothetical protein
MINNDRENKNIAKTFNQNAFFFANGSEREREREREEK